ncbi:DUF2283 domain-containing protein [Candidatus Peregrinibacteria bacterium]|nr:DUF2283 domain-containing protein [Candidatus Peregrinibacteria bacterium]
MQIIYDDEVDAAYIRFTKKPAQVTTQRISEDVAINYDSKNEVVGIEILSASEHLFPRSGKLQLEVQNAEIATLA